MGDTESQEIVRPMNDRMTGQVLFALSSAVFGQRLDETVAYEQKFGPHLVPILVEKCADFILEHGRNEEGIFRLPGQDNLVKQLRDAFDAGERPSFDRYSQYPLQCPASACPSAWLGWEGLYIPVHRHGTCIDTSKSPGLQQKKIPLLQTVS
ncbi:Rho GTPase-activating protein 25 [Saguinus oedipus]|uniref:Rho GTPase-activating protein 25 n=1 Tax=Saguinus oedipus TaxID=9490 RepID=A0ABQ9U6X8_SAGOE|nr:Rho GTPase-activating protein 25 [Saguinus oedipus]